jgi:exportin-5
VSHLASGQAAAWALKSKAAMLAAAVVRRLGPEAYSDLLPRLVAAAREGPLQAEVSLLVLQFVSEDLTQFEEAVGSGEHVGNHFRIAPEGKKTTPLTTPPATSPPPHHRQPGAESKRLFLHSLLASVETVLPFVVGCLEQHYSAGMTAAQQGQAQAAVRAHAAVVTAGLGVLSAFVEWAPLGQLASSVAVEACAFFLASGQPDFRAPALEVLRQMAGRKAASSSGANANTNGGGSTADAVAAVQQGLVAPTPELLQRLEQQSRPDPEQLAYRTLMAKLGEALLSAAAIALAAGSHDQLGYDGALEEHGQRLLGVLVQYGESHFRCLGGPTDVPAAAMGVGVGGGGGGASGGGNGNNGSPGATPAPPAAPLPAIPQPDPEQQLAKRYQYLQHMLGFTRHPHVPLAAAALPFWGALLRDSGGIGASGAGLGAASLASAGGRGSPVLIITSPTGGGAAGNSAAAQAAQAAAAAQAHQHQQALLDPSAPPPPGSGFRIPADACAALVEAIAQQLLRVTVRYDGTRAGGDAAELPSWCADDGGLGQWKEAGSNYRAQAKMVARQAAVVAPARVLGAVGSLVEAALELAEQRQREVQQQQQQQQQQAGSPAPPPASAAASDEDAASCLKRHVHMESAVHLLEAVVPPLTDEPLLRRVATTGPAPVSLAEADATAAAVREGLTSLLRRLLPLRPREPRLAELHARALEALARLLNGRPDLVEPLIHAAFEAMTAIWPLGGGGGGGGLENGGGGGGEQQDARLPPPPRVSQAWRDDAVARMCLAKVPLNAAKAAPQALVPHLPAVAARAQQLWDAGRLREGEKLALHEGLMAAASAAGPPQMQAELLEHVLRPVRARWTDQAWLAGVASPEAFAATYIAIERGPDGSVAVGSR